jgi:hypothetical protein
VKRLRPEAVSNRAKGCHVSCVLCWRITIYCPPCEGFMPGKPHRETPIEHIYLEVTGRKMPLAIKRVLLRNRKSKVNE